jgi:microcystin-dependent protein
MEIPNIFKNRAGAIQLSDLDGNFDTVKVTVNRHEEQITSLQNGQTTLTNMINNFSAIPSGCIILWSGSVTSVPSGWKMCDGTNATPDLRDKFVIGARSDSGGTATTFVTGADTKSGGSKDAVLVSHIHNATSSATVSSDTDSWTASIRAERSELFANGGIATQGYDYTMLRGTANDYGTNNTVVNISNTHTHAHTVNVATSVTTTGESGTNKNLPPYYSLAYIMKV